jgi:hypothetical protein
VKVELLDGVPDDVNPPKTESMSYILQTWFLTYSLEFYSFYPQCHFAKVCREKRTHA